MEIATKSVLNGLLENAWQQQDSLFKDVWLQLNNR